MSEQSQAIIILLPSILIKLIISLPLNPMRKIRNNMTLYRSIIKIQEMLQALMAHLKDHKVLLPQLEIDIMKVEAEKRRSNSLL